MKNLLIIILILIFPLLIFGQEKLNKLSAPTSPASSILGLEPSSVLSPKSYQALETALYANFLNSDGNAVIPNDFALEFTPYWTKNHGLSFEEYLYPKNNLSLIARNSSISLASTQNFQLGDSTASNGLAFGYRTTLYLGNKNDRQRIEGLKKILNNNQQIITKLLKESYELTEQANINNKEDFFENIKKVVINLIYEYGEFKDEKDAEELITRIYSKLDSLPNFDKSAPDNFIDAFRELIDIELKSLYTFENFESYIKERQGFSLDIAYAWLISFPTNNFEFSFIPHQSIWLTPSYRFKDNWSFLKIMGVIRYEWYSLDYYKEYFPETVIYENNIDYGIAVSGEFKKFSIRFETVGRISNSEIPAGTDNDGNELFRKEQNTDFQYIGSFSYNLSEQIALTYSLGNRFEPIINPNNTLVSLLTLNLGFGSPTKEEDLNLKNN